MSKKNILTTDINSGNTIISKKNHLIFINENSIFQQIGGILIICTFAILFFGIAMISSNPSLKPVIFFMVLISGIMSVISLTCRGKYIFNTKTQELTLERQRFLVKSKTNLGSFSGIAMIGVTSVIKISNKRKKHESFKLLIALKSNPSALITLINGSGITKTLGLKQLNEICQILAEITKCEKIILGSPKTEIQAIKCPNGVTKYEEVEAKPKESFL